MKTSSNTRRFALAALTLLTAACEPVGQDGELQLNPDALETSAEALVCGAASGLTHAWRFQGTAQDSVGTTHGTPVMPIIGGSLVWPVGHFGRALRFGDLSARYLNLNSAGIVSGRSAYTVSLWVRPSAANSAVVYGETESGGVGPHVQINTNYPSPGQVYFEHRDNRGVAVNYTFDTTYGGTRPGLADNGWHHIALVRSAPTAWLLYVDGVASGTPPAVAPGATSTTMTSIGGAMYGGGAADYLFRGDIDDVRTYARGLSPVEVGQIVADTRGDLTHAWEMNEASGSASADAVGVANGTVVGGVSRVAGVEGRALSFNGTTGYVSLPSAGFLSNLRNYTLAGWVKTGSAAPSVVYAENSDQSPGAHVQLMLNHPAPGDIYFEHRDNASVSQNGVFHTGSPGIADSGWHHVALTRSGGTTWTLYFDGVAQPVASTGDPGVTSTTYAGLGAMLYPAPDYLLNGALDSIRTYRKALSAAEIDALRSPDNCFTAP